MTRTAARTPSTRKTGNALEAWLLGEPELDSAALALLAAYRDAAEVARAPADAAGSRGATTEPAEDGSPTGPAVPRTAPAVPRLRTVEGVEESRLAALHGGLIADGFLTTELLGRSDGLAYRVTREGLRRLAGGTDEAEAAA